MDGFVEMSRAEFRRVRRLVDSVEPDNVGKVLRHDRYWTPGFLQLYLRRCDRCRFVEPEAAHSLVEPLGTMLDRARFPSVIVGSSFRLVAYSLMAEVFALCGELDRAEDVLRQADAVLVGQKVHREAAADYFRHAAVVARLHGQPDRAAGLLRRAIDLYRQFEGDERLGLAEALGLQGKETPASVVGLAEAFYWIQPRAIGRFRKMLFERTWSSLHDGVLNRGTGPDALRACLCWLKGTDRKWFVHRPPKPPRVGLRWTEGRIFDRLGLGRMALRRLSLAWRDAGRLELWEAFMLVTLDRAVILWSQQETDQARDFLHEARRTIHHESGEDLLRRASEAVCLRDLETIRREVTARPAFLESLQASMGSQRGQHGRGVLPK